jgi:hypothetical protein
MNEPRPRTEAQLIELLRSSDVRAPQELHGQIAALIADGSARPRRGRMRARPSRAGGWPLARGLAAGAALAGVVVAVLLGVTGGGGGSTLNVREASALTLSAASAPAPRESSSNSAELTASVQGVHFPYWEEHLGWRSTGQRVDHVAGRTVSTVFYANNRGQRIGYAIVAGTPAPHLSGGAMVWHGTTAYRLLQANGASVVTWLRDGRMCVLSGRGVDGATLLALARWGEGRGSAT